MLVYDKRTFDCFIQASVFGNKKYRKSRHPLDVEISCTFYALYNTIELKSKSNSDHIPLGTQYLLLFLLSGVTIYRSLLEQHKN